MGALATLRSMCAPAQIYFGLGAVGLLSSIFQNVEDDSKLCVGDFECEVASAGAILIAQGVYILVWTFILSCICKAGHKNIAWFLVLIPFILGAIILALFMMSRPGYKRKSSHDPHPYMA